MMSVAFEKSPRTPSRPHKTGEHGAEDAAAELLHGVDDERGLEESQIKTRLDQIIDRVRRGRGSDMERGIVAMHLLRAIGCEDRETYSKIMGSSSDET